MHLIIFRHQSKSSVSISTILYPRSPSIYLFPSFNDLYVSSVHFSRNMRVTLVVLMLARSWWMIIGQMFSISSTMIIVKLLVVIAVIIVIKVQVDWEIEPLLYHHSSWRILFEEVPPPVKYCTSWVQHSSVRLLWVPGRQWQVVALVKDWRQKWVCIAYRDWQLSGTVLWCCWRIILRSTICLDFLYSHAV